MDSAVLDYPNVMTAKPNTRKRTHRKREKEATKTSDPSAEGVQLTIDELTAETGVPSRTIRYYQSKGALAKPEIQGRIAYYNQGHIERLQLIAQLQDRGLSIKAIRDLVLQIDRGEISLNEWLGLKDELQQPWLDDRPKLMSLSELQEFSGSKRPGLAADLERGELIERKGDQFYLPSPRLLQIAIQLENSGLDIDASLRGARMMREHMGALAEELVKFYVRDFGSTEEADDPEKLATALNSLRPLGLEAVQLIFGQAVESTLKELIESGKLIEMTGKQKQKRTRKSQVS